MTIAERNNKLKHFITCLKCEVSGKPCDVNCPTQYDAGNMGEIIENLEVISKALEQEPKTGQCKDCKYFEYDSIAKVDGVSLIVAHEICSKWGDGCKTKECGYCFLFEPQESEGQE